MPARHFTPPDYEFSLIADGRHYFAIFIIISLMVAAPDY